MLFKTIFNEDIDALCAGCVVMDNSKFKDGRIYQSKFWDLSQDFEIAYPGMMVISPMRHVSNYTDITEEEITELHLLTTHCKKALSKIFDCSKFANMFYEKPNGHIHFVIIPLQGLVKIENKYAVLAELMAKIPELRQNEDNMKMVVDTIHKLRKSFSTLSL